MNYEFKPSFDRRFKKLAAERQTRAYEALNALMNYLDRHIELPPGLGLKNWKSDYWEIRTSLKDRILFKYTDHVTFLFIGNHDDLRKFMKKK